MGHVKDIIDLAEKFIERRSPLQVTCQFQGDTPPIFTTVVTNISKSEPVAVKEIRVHFGMKEYNHAFVLMPRRVTDISPKHDAQFHLSYDGSILQRHLVLDSPDKIDFSRTLESAPNLFMAIANAKPDDSWIEVDFNEFRGRQFLKGHIQPIFKRMLVIGKKTMSQPPPAPRTRSPERQGEP